MRRTILVDCEEDAVVLDGTELAGGGCASGAARVVRGVQRVRMCN